MIYTEKKKTLLSLEREQKNNNNGWISESSNFLIMYSFRWIFSVVSDF